MDITDPGKTTVIVHIISSDNLDDAVKVIRRYNGLDEQHRHPSTLPKSSRGNGGHGAHEVKLRKNGTIGKDVY